MMAASAGQSSLQQPEGNAALLCKRANPYHWQVGSERDHELLDTNIILSASRNAGLVSNADHETAFQAPMPSETEYFP
jgi:hypothetical protein